MLSYWSEAGTEKEEILGALMRACDAERCPVAMDAGWEDWDIEIAGGLAGGARILIAGENHGADKRLLRVRAALRPSGLACAVVGGLAALTLAGLLARWPAAAMVGAILALIAGAAAAWQLGRFARRLHLMIETAAQRSRLVPVEPISPTQPAIRPRTA